MFVVCVAFTCQIGWKLQPVATGAARHVNRHSAEVVLGDQSPEFGPERFSIGEVRRDELVDGFDSVGCSEVEVFHRVAFLNCGGVGFQVVAAGPLVRPSYTPGRREFPYPQRYAR